MELPFQRSLTVTPFLLIMLPVRMQHTTHAACRVVCGEMLSSVFKLIELIYLGCCLERPHPLITAFLSHQNFFETRRINFTSHMSVISNKGLLN